MNTVPNIFARSVVLQKQITTSKMIEFSILLINFIQSTTQTYTFSSGNDQKQSKDNNNDNDNWTQYE